MEKVNDIQAKNTQPEENGTQEQKLFTQEEVNRIVSDRLARERSKTEAVPSPADQREAELNARENRLICKEYLYEKEYPERLAEIFKTDNADEFKRSVEKLLDVFPHLLDSLKITTRLEGNPPVMSSGCVDLFQGRLADAFKR